MSVDTRSVQGRRNVRYRSLDDILADAESLRAGGYDRLGNWSLGQVSSHLANVLNMGIDGGVFSLPSPLQALIRLFMKETFLEKTAKPGFKLPKKIAAKIGPRTDEGPKGDEEGLDQLRRALARWKQETTRAPNGLLGRLSLEEWDRFQLRHAELHMSFLVPRNG